MDTSTLKRIAELICGDNPEISTVYRTGGEITRFFERAGLPHLRHDGSTRLWWTIEALKICSDEQLNKVILRLASPREYEGDAGKVKKAVNTLNGILSLEGIKIGIKGVEPFSEKIDPNFELKTEEELKPLPPPDFNNIGLEPGLGELLLYRWQEADRCLQSKAYLAATIMMGSLLEGILLGTLVKKPKEANLSPACPKDSDTGKPKQFHQWKLAEMIDVAHTEGWLDQDVKKFSHSLRDFRNLIHPYQQLATGTKPDEDTCNICWYVVQAAVNDLARTLKGI